MLKLKFILTWVIVSVSFVTIGAPPEIISIRSNADSVGLYDKFEAGLNIKAEFVNPFNPDEIDIGATFIAPSGKRWNVNGFYNYSYASIWKMRFSANETGKWQYAIKVKDKNGTATSETKSFTVVKSALQPFEHFVKTFMNYY